MISRRVHVAALSLTAVLTGAFISATFLYATYGKAVVDGVFEQNQIALAERAKGHMVVIHYMDYTRLYPSNLNMRARLVDSLVSLGRSSDALRIANEGVGVASVEDVHLAKLLLARVQIAMGNTDAAVALLDELVESKPNSGETRYYLAVAAAAKGDFSVMFNHFGHLRELGDRESSEEFRNRRIDAASKADSCIAANDSDESASLGAECVLAHILLGEPERAFAVARLLTDPANADARTLFWMGVTQELEGDTVLARQFYRASSELNESLAEIALLRLR